MRSRSFWLSTLILFSPAAIQSAGQLSVSSAINATATVIHPVGLIEARETAEILDIPVIAEFSSRWFLFIPRGNAIVMLNETPIEIEQPGSGNVVTALDLTALIESRRNGRPVTVTVIYSGN
jgi:hypothetical protein